MESEYGNILVRLLLAALAGGMIGFERTYHGRPAGFRTHTLVCTASSLLMLVTVHQWHLFPEAPLQSLRVDPTRMAQGIMTGIGFLGAGVIMKDGLSVRGLTTAASIWITAAIGILVGVGFYFPAVVATALTLGALSLLRWIEIMTPSLSYARLRVQFLREQIMPREPLMEMIRSHDMSAAAPAYRLQGEGRVFEYQMTLRTRQPDNYRKLAETLTGMNTVLEFYIAPMGD